MTLDASPSTGANHAVPSEDNQATPSPGSLTECVAHAVKRYLRDMDGCGTDTLYELVLNEVERPLIDEVMKFHRGNQSRAAAVLGINRATLRKKLRLHGLG